MKPTTAATPLISILLAGLVAGSPRPQETTMPLPSCVDNCISQVVSNGTCSSTSDLSCICNASSLNPCIQANCPPSLVDPVGDYCASVLSTSSASGFTIQTDTLSGGTTPTATFTDSITRTFNPSGIQSPGVSVTTVTGSASVVSASATTTSGGEASIARIGSAGVALAVGACVVAMVL